MSKGDKADCARLLKVLGHPTRLAILEALLPGPKCVTDVCEICEGAQPNISQHLLLLRQEGVVDFYDEGRSRCYFVTRPGKLRGIFAALCASEDPIHPDCCRPESKPTTKLAKRNT